MEENRFLRTYKEHKREQQQQQEGIKPNYNNRFECLRDKPIEREINRFECLRGNTNINPRDSQDIRANYEINRFSCLVDTEYINKTKRFNSERESKPKIKESINSLMKRYVEEKKIIGSLNKPSLTIVSEYHFPELCKLSEPKKKEMIVNTTIVPNNKKTITVMSFKGGKVITKEVYEDGTDVESDIVMIKKPNYTSWASVLKDNKTETIYYAKVDSIT